MRKRFDIQRFVAYAKVYVASNRVYFSVMTLLLLVLSFLVEFCAPTPSAGLYVSMVFACVMSLEIHNYSSKNSDYVRRLILPVSVHEKFAADLAVLVGAALVLPLLIGSALYGAEVVTDRYSGGYLPFMATYFRPDRLCLVLVVVSITMMLNNFRIFDGLSNSNSPTWGLVFFFVFMFAANFVVIANVALLSKGVHVLNFFFDGLPVAITIVLFAVSFATFAMAFRFYQRKQITY